VGVEWDPYILYVTIEAALSWGHAVAQMDYASCFYVFLQIQYPCKGTVPRRRALQYAQQIISFWSIVELHSTALSAVPGTMSSYI
jgi:hypothetical protein